jgi:uncharacterized repeat protein (TIGR03803 family)
MATVTTLAIFSGQPFSGLLADAAGDLFGTTTYGGPGGGGTVFELVNDGNDSYTFTTLVAFGGSNVGIEREGTLIADAAGNLFGTTIGGGPYSVGTVFEIPKTSTGYASTPITLATFNLTNGAEPFGGLIMDAAGDLFGTTAYQGAEGSGGSGGTVFEIAKTSTGYASTPTTLVNFNGTNGSIPQSTLLADAAGDIFGTAVNGGPSNVGTVFELVHNGSGSVLSG